MSRFPAVVILACLYVACCIWIVGNAGQAHRESLRQAKLAAEKAMLLAAEPVKAPTPVTSTESASPPPSPAARKPATVAAASPPAQPAGKKPPVPAPRDDSLPAPRTDPPAAKPAVPKPAGSPADGKAPAPVASANPLAKYKFWSRPELARNWDVAHLKAEDELRLGAELHDLIVQLNPTVEDGPWLARVEDAAEPLLKTRLRKDISYTFTILDSDAVNAFSHPGGYVYVSRGLFNLIGEDEDYALQFAVGHEIAHVDLQHAVKCLQDPGVMNLSMGTLQKLYTIILPFGYLVSEKVDQELEADEWVFRRMLNLGRSKRESLAFLQKFEGYAQKNGFGSGRAKEPLFGDESSPLDNAYRRKTAARKHLRHLQEDLK